MKLTKEECEKALEWFKLKQCKGCLSQYPNCWSKCIETPYTTLVQLIVEHFKLKKDFEITCKLHDELLENYNKQKKRMKQLEQENGKLKKQVHSYYMAMVTGKGE